MIRDSLPFQDFGVLLRANHLTRALEEVFRKENIPYLVSGGMSFFERQEVRDMLAYLKLIANHDDDTSLLRIVNTPRRGIGRKLLERATAHAAEHHCSLFSAVAALGTQPGLGPGGEIPRGRGRVHRDDRRSSARSSWQAASSPSPCGSWWRRSTTGATSSRRTRTRGTRTW